MNNAFPSGLYAPYGHNDNNFNRIPMPSNIYPTNGGMTGNPTGRFNPITTNTQYNMNNMPSMTNFDKAYTPNNQIIEKIDYTNKGALLHNNIAENILDEHVVEYRLNIDSSDRDIKYYPNQFSFSVKLNPISGNSIQTEEYVDDKNKGKGTKIVETRFDGPPAPHINKQFKNVKYVKLENVILPQCATIKQNHENECVFDASHNLITDRFVSLVINELNCDRTYTTSEGVTRSDDRGNYYTPPTPFAIIIPDKLLGCNFYSGTPYYGTKIYKNSFFVVKF